MVGVIVQAVTGLDGMTYTRQQLAAAVAAGLRIQGYVFPGWLSNKLPMFNGFPIERLWLDLELHITRAEVDRTLLACDAWAQYLSAMVKPPPTGIYSGKWFFDKMSWSGHSYWASRDLWDARYDGIPETQAGFVRYGGWTSCLMKQYRGTSTIGSVSEVDLDVTG